MKCNFDWKAIPIRKSRKTAQDIGYVKERFPEVPQNLGHYKFPGRRQQNTPVLNIDLYLFAHPSEAVEPSLKPAPDLIHFKSYLRR